MRTQVKTATSSKDAEQHLLSSSPTSSPSHQATRFSYDSDQKREKIDPAIQRINDALVGFKKKQDKEVSSAKQQFKNIEEVSPNLVKTTKNVFTQINNVAGVQNKTTTLIDAISAYQNVNAALNEPNTFYQKVIQPQIQLAKDIIETDEKTETGKQTLLLNQAVAENDLSIGRKIASLKGYLNDCPKKEKDIFESSITLLTAYQEAQSFIESDPSSLTNVKAIEAQLRQAKELKDFLLACLKQLLHEWIKIIQQQKIYSLSETITTEERFFGLATVKTSSWVWNESTYDFSNHDLDKIEIVPLEKTDKEIALEEKQNQLNKSTPQRPSTSRRNKHSQKQEWKAETEAVLELEKHIDTLRKEAKTAWFFKNYHAQGAAKADALEEALKESTKKGVVNLHTLATKIEKSKYTFEGQEYGLTDRRRFHCSFFKPKTQELVDQLRAEQPNL